MQQARERTRAQQRPLEERRVDARGVVSLREKQSFRGQRGEGAVDGREDEAATEAEAEPAPAEPGAAAQDEQAEADDREQDAQRDARAGGQGQERPRAFETPRAHTGEGEERRGDEEARKGIRLGDDGEVAEDRARRGEKPGGERRDRACAIRCETPGGAGAERGGGETEQRGEDPTPENAKRAPQRRRGGVDQRHRGALREQEVAVRYHARGGVEAGEQVPALVLVQRPEDDVAGREREGCEDRDGRGGLHFPT